MPPYIRQRLGIFAVVRIDRFMFRLTGSKWYERRFSSGGSIYKGADKSLARPGRKQATATEDFEFHISYL
jgi:hypothetical protein